MITNIRLTEELNLPLYLKNKTEIQNNKAFITYFSALKNSNQAEED